MPIRPKKALLDQVADAISRARWAEKDLQDLDQRAWKMQGNSKSWAKNAGKFNDRAAALEAKMNYNNWLSNKLRGDAQENVNRSNAEWNKRMNDMMNDQRVYINLDELANAGYAPKVSEVDARRVGRMSGVDNVDGKSADEIAYEMYEDGLYPQDGQDIDRFNISGCSAIEDIVPEVPYDRIPIRSGESGWDAARNAINQFRKYNTKPVWDDHLFRFRASQEKAEEAMRAYQNGGKRYRQ